MKAKTTMWMMKSASGRLIKPTGRHTRHGCIQAIEENHGPSWPWKRLYRNGARIVRVAVREI
jgi:hypothetical protein